MTSPRSSIISLESTPWYHCVCRCVRRAFLCGKDKDSGKDFEHRRGWIAERIMELAAIFSIDVAAYAVLSNHYHIVMRVDEDRALAWTDHEVFTRWVQLFKGPDVVRRYLAEDGDLSHSDQHQLAELAGLYRSRLYDISWFMRMLNESIARKANQEEGISGRFWEVRFKSQALLDEKAILAAMVYVDLNPVRAGVAKTPEESEYTSIKERLDALKFSSLNESESITLTSILASRASATAQRGRVNESENDARLREPQPPGIESLSHLGRTSDTSTEKPRATLAPFDDLTDMPFAIPFGFHEYVELVDWTGRQLRRKKMSIREKTPPILSRLGVDAAVFVSSMDTLLEKFGTAVGDPEVLRMHCKLRGLRCMPGVRCDVFFDAA
ncbi:hypothetical protein LZ24_03396 [Desulfobotulus alkaliphilus]|uniref:Transposase IS200-like domain-containing protein n=1 Tax=Desulfobotulus alkaliphilus TaxID=622671 RepID=A0A562QZ19_9BACT|nr:transposase [Desulfobotulus alkaliphilus]TWI62069.1 hypothetical protein LZ24_03396 [Desulfobotulus alkaliphilus]